MGNSVNLDIKKPGAILIGSNLANNIPSNVQGREKYNVKGREKYDNQEQGNLLGTLNDVAQVNTLLLKTGFHVQRRFTDGYGYTKTIIENQIRQLLHTNSFALLYYSGHGRNDGAWCIEIDNQIDYITFDDIYQIWVEENRPPLLIIMDSCHSGAWVEQCKQRQLANFFVQASCLANQLSYDSVEGGIFTQNYIRRCESTLYDSWSKFAKSIIIAILLVPTLYDIADAIIFSIQQKSIPCYYFGENITSSIDIETQSQRISFMAMDGWKDMRFQQ